MRAMIAGLVLGLLAEPASATEYTFGNSNLSGVVNITYTYVVQVEFNNLPYEIPASYPINWVCGINNGGGTWCEGVVYDGADYMTDIGVSGNKPEIFNEISVDIKWYRPVEIYKSDGSVHLWHESGEFYFYGPLVASGAPGPVLGGGLPGVVFVVLASGVMLRRRHGQVRDRLGAGSVRLR